MATFTALAVLTTLTTDLGLLVGLLLGAAFMVKYVAVFERPPCSSYFLLRQRRASAALTPILGAAIPPGATILLYAAAGRFGIWWHDSIASNFRRVDVPFTAAGDELHLPHGTLALGADASLRPRHFPSSAFPPARNRNLFKRLAAGRRPRRGRRQILLRSLFPANPAGALRDSRPLVLPPAPPCPPSRPRCFWRLSACPPGPRKPRLRNTAGPDAPMLAVAALKTQHPTSISVFDTSRSSTR